MSKGSFIKCKDNGRCDSFDTCPAGTIGTETPSDICKACPAGWTSFRGSLVCQICEKGKFSKTPSSTECKLCDKSQGEYADEPQLTKCKICEQGKVSTGTDVCTTPQFDLTLPVPKSVLIKRTDALSWHELTITWTSELGYQSFLVTISTSVDFLSSDTLIHATKETQLTINNVHGQDLRNTIHYAKVESVGIDNTKKSQASVTSPAWKSKGAQSCALDTQFLDCASLDPRKWDCAPCPAGGYCGGFVTWEEIGPLFGWWKIPASERTITADTSNTTTNQNVFAECLFPPACLGSANPLLVDRYPEASATTPYEYVPGSNSSCSWRLGFQNQSRLCHSCRANHKREGTNRCAECPKNEGENWALMFLGTVVILVILVALVWDAIGDAGKQELSAILQKIIVNFLQVVSLCSAFPLRWPPALEGMFEVQGAISTLGEHLVNPDCVTSSSTAAELYYSKQLVFAMLPVFVALFSFFFWYAVGKKRSTPFFEKRTNDEKNTPKDNFVVTMTSVLYLLYPTLCKNAFGMFDCKKIGDTSYLRADLEEECYTGSHAQAVFSLGMTQFLLYVIGLPVIVMIFLHRNQDRLETRVVLARYGLFYGGYKPERFLWEVIITARKVSIVALSVFGPELGPQKQAQVALLLLLVCIVCEIYGDPFLEKDASYKVLAQLEVSSLIVPWLTMWSGLVIYELAEDSPIAVLLSFLVILANGVLMLFSVFKFIRLKLAERKRKKLEAEAREEAEQAAAAESGENVESGNKSILTSLSQRFRLKKNDKKNHSGGDEDGVEMMGMNELTDESLGSDSSSGEMKIQRDENDLAQNPLYGPSPSQSADNSTQLPIGWEKHIDEHGKTYYTNKETQESQWEAPAGAMGGSASETFTEEDVYNPMDDWDKHQDEHGRTYYTNKETQESQWEAPAGATSE